GGEVFDTSFKPQGSDSFAGAICKNCGHLVTEDESSQFDDEIVDNIFGALTRDFLK
ncbi:TPA: ECs_2282 family putative zinc-binding protein, partial [Escherichia coli]